MTYLCSVMNAIYKGKKVRVTKLILGKNEFITYPLIVQVRIEWKKDGMKLDDYVNANEIEFID